jgi:hypothetical protein
MSRTEKEKNMSDITGTGTELQDRDEDERIVELVSSSVSSLDDGEVVVCARAYEEPWTVETGMRLTEDDALELREILGQAAQMVAGTEPQAFIRLVLLDDTRP